MPSGAAVVQMGTETITLRVLMVKAQGLPHGDAATGHALRDAVRRSELAHLDETGWKVDAQLRWR